MSMQELIHLYFDRSTALQNYWTLYVVVIGGLLAFSSLRLRTSWVTTLMVTILYSSFAYKNLGAIRDTTFQRAATLEIIRDTARQTGDGVVNKLLGTMEIPDYPGVRNFHVLCDALTVATLWVFEIRRRRYERNPLVVSNEK